MVLEGRVGKLVRVSDILWVLIRTRIEVAQNLFSPI
jgi:hypothetical protein